MRRASPGRAAVLVLLLAAATPASAQEWPSGHVSVFLDYLPNHSGAVELRPRVFLEERVDLTSHLRVTASGFVEGLVARRSSDGQPSRRVTDAVVRPQDISLEVAENRLDVLVGFSRVVWGKLDELQPTDVINPLDVSRFFFEGRSEARLPVLLVRARVFLSEAATLEGIYVPAFRKGRFDQLDEPSSPFNIARSFALDPDVCAPIGCPAQPPVVTREPAVTMTNAQGGVRFSGTTGRVDWSASAYRGFEPFAHVEASVSPSPPPLVVGRHPRFTMLGGDVEAVWGEWGLRGEFAVFPEDSFQSGDLRIVSGRSFDAGAGVDRRSGGVTVSATVLVHGETYDTPLASGGEVSGGRTDVSLIGSADRTFARERYRVRGFGVWNAGESSTFVRGIGMASLRDNVALEASAGWFVGGGRDLVSQFSDTDFVYVRVKYYF